MVAFADRISDDVVGRRLARAIQGSGAFRRFKAELHEEYPQLLPVWYAFRDARTHRAVEWLADNSVTDHDAATRILDEHPEPQPTVTRTTGHSDDPCRARTHLRRPRTRHATAGGSSPRPVVPSSARYG